ncbi:MAG: hypothetical protein U1F98_07100 [Verrucomicrobiota bacterium]
MPTEADSEGYPQISQNTQKFCKSILFRVIRVIRGDNNPGKKAGDGLGPSPA